LSGNKSRFFRHFIKCSQTYTYSELQRFTASFLSINPNSVDSVYAAIELMNGEDVALVSRHVISKTEIKRITVNMIINSKAYNMVINEDIQKRLALPFIEKRKFIMPDGKVEEFEVVGPMHVNYKNHTLVCTALLLKGDAEPVFGSIVMQGLQTPLRLPSVKLL
jgi:hypothetical protein